jgi:hypothetical protein
MKVVQPNTPKGIRTGRDSPTQVQLPQSQVVADPSWLYQKTVSKPYLFRTLELCLSEKQTPQVIVFSRSRQNEESV